MTDGLTFDNGDRCPLTGKVKFKSPSDADHRRIRIKKRRGEKLSVFRCKSCRCWHLGHDDYGLKHRRAS